MRNHSAMGNKAAITYQFENFRKQLQEEIGISPSEKTISLYKSLTYE